MQVARKQVTLWAIVAFLAGFAAGIGFVNGYAHGVDAARAAQVR